MIILSGFLYINKIDNTVKGGFFFIGWCNGKTVDLYMIHGDVAYVECSP